MTSLDPARRRLIQALGAGAALSLLGNTRLAGAAEGKPLGRVVVIGAGFGGATAAKYIRKWSGGRIEVVLLERNKEFFSCPTSNEVLGGTRAYESLRRSYQGLTQNWGVRLVHANVMAVDPDRRRVKTDGAGDFDYDRLVVSPGFDFIFPAVEGFDAKAQETILHAWKSGPQTLALRRQLMDMPDGGAYVLSIPRAPYRCPPGPYERASLIAFYFKHHKPKSKVIILDANDKVQSKEKLFKAVWASDYRDIVEYHPEWNLASVDAARKEVTSEVGDKLRGDVLNILPPMRAADIARQAGLVNVNDRWCDVNWITLESTAVKNVHVLGDALQAAPQMPKSGHMANQHGKAAAAAIVEIFSGREPQPTLMANTCYSMVDDKRAIHVSSVHRYSREKRAPLPVEGSGGVSSAPSEAEGRFTHAWAENIWADTLA